MDTARPSAALPAALRPNRELAMHEKAENPGLGPHLPELFEEEKKKAVLRQLNRILDSAAFRGSKRSRDCLRFIVEKTLEGHREMLKERCIGSEVFGRIPDYDTNADAVVRISANELRKRLAQYHLSAGTSEEVRIELPPGSYIPEFHFPDTDNKIELPPHALPPAASFNLRRHSRWLWALAIVVVLGASARWGWTRFAQPPTVLEQFWAPVLQSPRPVLLAPGSAVVYLLARPTHEKFDALNKVDVEVGPHVVNLQGQPLPADQIVPVQDQYTGIGDAVAVGRFMEMFGRLGKQSQVRFGADTTFADLRNAPTVLISAFTNRWNLDIARELRFSFTQLNHNKMITDRTSPDRIWRTEMDASGHTKLDYALVSRVFNQPTGQPIIQAGGITQYGTQAAAEFLTTAQHLDRLARQLPPDWMSRNLQVVLQIKVIGNTPSLPEIVAVHCW